MLYFPYRKSAFTSFYEAADRNSQAFYRIAPIRLSQPFEYFLFSPCCFATDQCSLFVSPRFQRNLFLADRATYPKSH